MDIRVSLSDDPASVLNVAGEFLASQPVRHNIILSLLQARIAHREPGRYWVAQQNNQVVGVVFQSPLTFAATVTPMNEEVTASIVDAIASDGVVLPGVSGEAATAAVFAGHWAERCRSAAIPFQGMRLYELTQLRGRARIDGKLRRASAEERGLMIEWVGAFQTEIGEAITDPDVVVDRWLPAGQLWLWDMGEPMSMAATREPAEGVIRVAAVYTPPKNRRRGYAEACVFGISKWIRQAGYRCILYTDLGNPTSNSIYRRIGYRAVGEVLRYRFE